jgi:hypothetical protein
VISVELRVPLTVEMNVIDAISGGDGFIAKIKDLDLNVSCFCIVSARNQTLTKDSSPEFKSVLELREDNITKKKSTQSGKRISKRIRDYASRTIHISYGTGIEILIDFPLNPPSGWKRFLPAPRFIRNSLYKSLNSDAKGDVRSTSEDNQSFMP